MAKLYFKIVYSSLILEGETHTPDVLYLHGQEFWFFAFAIFAERVCIAKCVFKERF